MLHDVEQGTGAWHALRCGRVTASRVKDVMGTKAKREGYLWELVTERLTGQCSEHYVTEAMKWGSEVEPVARVTYEMQHNCTVDRPGFYTCDDIPWFGASPDGTTMDLTQKYSGLKGLEIKCPFNTMNHLKWMKDGVIPEKEHLDQVLSNMICSGLEEWDFMSFDPRLPENLQMFIVTCNKSDHADYMEEIAKEVKAFLQEVDKLTHWYKERI